ncbi:uncharacterized protein MYCFIDRAFT_33968, partial [Pseudocercospora fijiensis CIRAD86]
SLNVSALRWILHHRIPEAVDLHHGTPYAEIAKTCDVDQSFLERVIRFSMHDLIFNEPVPGHVSHTVYSAALVTGVGLKALIKMNAGDLASAGSKLIEAEEKWPGSQEATHSPWNFAFDTEAHWARNFTDMMEYDNQQPVYALRHVVDGYEWQSVKDVVDVGGGTGDLGLALAVGHSGLDVNVADRPATIDIAKTQTCPSTPPGLQFVTFDFFGPLPEEIAYCEVYLLRRILHDWLDQFAVKIIKNHLPALKAGAKMLVMEMVLPEPGELPQSLDKTIRSLDMLMKHVLNGKERSRTQCQQLFTSVDPDLVIASIKRPEGSVLSLLEVKCVNSRRPIII